MKAKLPANEEQRLKALKLYDILDTESESAYDDFTFLASQICQTPIALISLVDADRQWFKSKIGLKEKETHRDFAFCSHAILDEEVLVVPDATIDDRFADNKLVTEYPKIRFYAGAPLINPDGYNLGTLCVIDKSPRQLNEYQKQALRALSRQIIAQMELTKTLKTLRGIKRLLSICSYCKQVRDEKNNWNELEKYMSDNSQLRFNHSVCPTCHEEKVLPEIEVFKNLLK